MIGRLVGDIVEKDLQQLLLDVNGVAYEVEIPLSTYYQLEEVSGPVSIYTHLVVRDDAHLLYGFTTKGERGMFRSLIKVNGVGPKMALAILSGLDTESFAAAVLNDDVKTLTGLPGVGKKTAERLIIEMRDKVKAMGVSVAGSQGQLAVDATGDAESALVGLGYKPQDAALAISKIEDPGGDVETLIRQALKQIMQGR